MTAQAIFQFLDPWLIWAFRLTDNPYVGFGLGIIFICLVTTVLGELCMAGVYFLNAKHFGKMNKDMVHNHNLSVKAIGVRNKTAWKACNSIANEAFGKNFFAHIALFASSIWMVPFGLGWIYYRFSSVDFTVPFIGAVGPAFYFIPAYILSRFLFEKAKPWIPLFRVIKRKIKENEGEEEMILFSDLAKPDSSAPDKQPAAGNI
ncbi:hypothetical protein [Pseudodesulfovibrio sp.]|uniref:hypothetical protein n=1 Tax=unclassified Pseudodesulfovibrio TaxID=2661612 RepID=UPI003B00C18E